MQIISIYDTETHSKGGGTIDIDQFFAQIRTGNWKTQVENIRLAKYNFKLEEKRVDEAGLSKEEILKDTAYQKAKAILKERKGAIHRVTIGGKFSDEGRTERNLINPSGLIDIDIDGLENDYELKQLKQRLVNDDYCQACFVTCGGDGLSFIVRIDYNKFLESYEGLKEYFFTNYGISIDVTHKNIANTRNASYDPHIFVNDKKSKLFNKYPKPKKKKEVQNVFVHDDEDFNNIIREIVLRRLDFCDTYENYRNIGFSIASKYGLGGLSYFHSVCQFNEKYNEKNTERDYKFFCKNPDKGIKIATFYWRCKDFNIETSSKKVSRIASVATASRKGGKTKEDTIKNLVKFENFTEQECRVIVDQVFDEKIDFAKSDTLLDEIETYIRHNYSLVKNQITGRLENNGVEWTEEDLNGLYISIKKVYENADAKWIERIIFSPFVKSYNPLRDFFTENKDKIPDELLEKHEIPAIIKKLWKSVKTDNPRYLEKFGTKWLVSIISSIFGEPSNLELDFAGTLNKGKSHFFKHLLPVELQKYFAKSDLDKGKDDEILMCHKILILMDECGGKTRQDEKAHKKLMDMEVFSIRRPYRKDNEDIKRLCVLCGTSNPLGLLKDSHGNRRIIPVNVLERDRAMYDSIDKAELLMAAYYLWKAGFKWRIDDDEIPELTQSTKMFNEYSFEYELVTKYFDKIELGTIGAEYYTATDVKMFIDNKTGQKTNLIKITNELRRIGFLQEFKDNGDGIDRNYYVMKPKDVVSNPIPQVQEQKSGYQQSSQYPPSKKEDWF